MSQTIKVKPWSADQGDHVVIDADSFNPEFHVPLDPPEPEPKARKTKADATPKAE